MDNTAYRHLSGWKKTGAYRIFITLKNKKNFLLIYKLDNFSLENMPALEGLPVKLGKIEYLLYSLPFSPMNVYLPMVYYVKKGDNPRGYQYYLEDLKSDYENILFDDKSSILFAAKKIKEITFFLTKWKENYKIDDFTIYNTKIKEEFKTYALRNFKSLQMKKPSIVLENVINKWDEISDLYINYITPDEKNLPTIHGDFNRSNFWLNTHNKNIIKATDWEWSRIGLPHSDLASLLIGQPNHFEKEALLEFSKCFDDYTLKENHEYYLYSKMERAILDCSYLAATLSNSNEKTKFNMRKFVDDASSRILIAYSEMK